MKRPLHFAWVEMAERRCCPSKGLPESEEGGSGREWRGRCGEGLGR